MLTALLHLALAGLVIALIIGALVWLVRTVPFIPAPYKGWAEWLLIAIGVILFVLRALPLLGGAGL
jgi:hypothetical protein